MNKMSPRISKLQPTPVYDTYWRFAAKRQEIFFRRLEGVTPWTDDPILMRHKFTNAYRASDRVSQYLIRNVLYTGEQTHDEIFFRTILFKLFNRIETWELLTRSFGPLRFADYNFRHYDDVLTAAMERGERLYSAAYIMPTARNFDGPRKHSTHLQCTRSAFHIIPLMPLCSQSLAQEVLYDGVCEASVETARESLAKIDFGMAQQRPQWT